MISLIECGEFEMTTKLRKIEISQNKNPRKVEKSNK